MIITISIDGDHLALFDRLVKQRKTNRSEQLRRWIKTGVIDLDPQVCEIALFKALDRGEDVNQFVNTILLKGLKEAD